MAVAHEATRILVRGRIPRTTCTFLAIRSLTTPGHCLSSQPSRLNRHGSSSSAAPRSANRHVVLGEIVEIPASAPGGRFGADSRNPTEESEKPVQDAPALATVYTMDPESAGWTRRKVSPRRQRLWSKEDGGFVPDFGIASSSILSHFLPSNYPHSVAPGYMNFCRGNFVASVAGSAAMVLSTQTLLLAVGVVGSAPSTSGAAATGTSGVLAGALNWVLKDGVGQLGGVLYASRQSRAFDAHPKQMRMVAAMALDAASLLEILSPSLPPTGVLPVACLANVLKNIGYLAASASRAALHQSLAKGSLGDVVAKAGSQAMAAGLLGTGLGIGLSMTILHNPHDFLWAWCALSCIHQAGNYWSLQSIVINHFNRQRLDIVLKDYLKSGKVPSPEEVGKQERIYDSLLPTFSGADGSWLVVGSRIDQACPAASDLPQYLSAVHGESYLLTVVADKSSSWPVVHLILFQSATGEDSIRGILHAHLLWKELTVDSYTGVDTNATGYQRLDPSSVVKSIAANRHHVETMAPSLLRAMREVGWKTETELTVVEPNHARRIVMRPTGPVPDSSSRLP